MAGTDDGEGGEDNEHRYQERSSEIRLWRSGSQIVDRKHTKRKEGIGPQLPSEARKRERWGICAAVAFFLTKPGAVFLYAQRCRYGTSTLRAKVSRKKRINDERVKILPATDRAASYAIKAVLNFYSIVVRSSTSSAIATGVRNGMTELEGEV